MEVITSSGAKQCFYAHLHGNAINYAFRGNFDGVSFDLVSADSLEFVPKLIVA